MTRPDGVRCPRCGQMNPPTTRQCVRCGLTRRAPGGPPARGGQPPRAGRPGQGAQPPRAAAPPPGPRPGRHGAYGAYGAPVRNDPPATSAGGGAEWSPDRSAVAPTPPPPHRDRDREAEAALAATGLRAPTQEKPTEEKPPRVRSDEEVAAPMLRRVGASAVDLALCAGLIVTPFAMVYDGDDSWWPPLILVLGVAVLVVVTVLRARSGRSRASGLFGVRTVTGDPGVAPGVRPMVRRHVVAAASTLAAGASVWSAFLDPEGRRRTWHDRASGTRVIDTRWGADPLDRAVEETGDDDGATDPGDGTGGEERADALPTRFAVRAAVLDSGLDMTPRAEDAAPDVPYSGSALSAPRAVVDAAERATGGTEEIPTPVVVIDEPAERVSARIVDDTGRAASLIRSVLVGRDPAAADGEQVDALFAMDDPTRTVSKTHLRIDADAAGGGVTVVDRHSSNGTAVRIGDVEQVLEPGVPLGVPIGTVLVVGDRTLILEAP